MWRRPLSLAAIVFASGGTAELACSISGIADGVRGSDGGGVTTVGDAAGTDGAAEPPCSTRSCDPTTIATGQGDIAAIATDGKVVVWSSNLDIHSCSVTGCTKPDVLFADEGLTGYLVIDGNALFFTSGRTGSQGVRTCDLPGCSPDVSLAFDLGTPAALAVDHGDVFLLETSSQRVLHVPSGPTVEIARPTAADGAIALGLSSVYWSVLGASPGIYMCPRTGCSGKTPVLFAGATTARALAVDLDAVRWTVYDEGTVESCPLAKCDAPTPLATGQNHPLGIVSDGTHVYWANEGDGTIVSLDPSIAGAKPTTIAHNVNRPRWLALDSSYVYFATGSGDVGRIAK